MKILSKFDLCMGYYQVRIKAGDESKMTISTRYGSYEFNIMPFGLTNTPVTFCTLIQEVLKEFLDKFIVIYLDSIAIYSNSMEELVGHLRQVLAALRANKLYVWKEKCEFDLREISFLCHIIGDGKIHMDPQKTKAILERLAPTSPMELRFLLG